MIASAYLEGVELAGGNIVLLPPQNLDRESARQIVKRIDGLLLCGGRDIEPARYGQNPLATSDQPDILRDHTEDLLLDAAIRDKTPILGICRGAQMLNVHRGGSLIQHVPDVVGDDRYQRGGGEFSMMQVSPVKGTLLHSLFSPSGEIGPCAMYHHQAIDELGDGLVVSAWSHDGLIEAVELVDHPFALAVQWHPEITLEDLTLFRALITAANHRRKTE